MEFGNRGLKASNPYENGFCETPVQVEFHKLGFVWLQNLSFILTLNETLV